MDIVFASIRCWAKVAVSYPVFAVHLPLSDTIDDTQKLVYYSSEQISSSLLAFRSTSQIESSWDLNDPTIFIISQ